MVPACPSHIASLYDTDQCSDLHTCTSLDLPYHIHFFMSASRTSYYGTFAVLTGFLCGYPMGAKTTSDLLNVNKISRSEASYLLSFCNNTSPAFILSYVVAQNMKERNLCIPFFLILTFTPLMLSFIFRLFYRLPESSCSFPQVTPGSFSNPSESISDSFLDRCILNAFESVTKVGGYMMMFSVLIQLLASVLPNTIFSLLLYSSLEISTGIRLLFSSALYTTEKIILCAFLTSFGGWCCIAQTYSMISSSQLPILPYITAKLVTALVTSLLISAYIYAI